MYFFWRCVTLGNSCLQGKCHNPADYDGEIMKQHLKELESLAFNTALATVCGLKAPAHLFPFLFGPAWGANGQDSPVMLNIFTLANGRLFQEDRIAGGVIRSSRSGGPESPRWKKNAGSSSTTAVNSRRRDGRRYRGVRAFLPKSDNGRTASAPLSGGR
jgi:hypothetical protein